MVQGDEWGEKKLCQVSPVFHEGSSERHQNPEAAVAYSGDIRGLYGKNRIRLLEPIHYGSWCGHRPQHLVRRIAQHLLVVCEVGYFALVEEAHTDG